MPPPRARSASTPKKIARKLSISLLSAAPKALVLAPSNSTDSFVSPVPDLLNSNAPPSDSERASIQDAIDRVSDEINTTVAIPTRSVKTRRHSEAGLKFIKTHKAILSPLRELPHEILSEIICTACETSFWDEHPTGFTFSPAGAVKLPWAASQVSRFWRSVTLSLHHLWAQIVIETCTRETCKPSKSLLPLVDTLLARSDHAPLRIHFSTSGTVDVEALRPVIDALVSSSDRWHTFHLTSESPVFDAFQGIRGRLASLQKLSLILAGENVDLTRPIDMFEYAPVLQDVYYWRDAYLGSRDIKLPWEQIRVFHDSGGSSPSSSTAPSTGYSRHTAIPTLRSARDIRIADFSIDDTQKPWPATTARHLHTLHIDFDDLDDTNFSSWGSDHFLPSLTAPALARCKITNYPGNPVPTLVALIGRACGTAAPSMTLQELSLSAFFMDECGEPGELSALLELTPRLRKLSVHLPSLVDLSRLVVVPGAAEPPLLPCLEELYIFMSSHENFHKYVGTISELAKSRCEAPHESSSSSSSESNTTSCPSPTGTRPGRLAHLRLISHSTFACHTIHEALERHMHAYSTAGAGTDTAINEKQRARNEEIYEECLARYDPLSTAFLNLVPSKFGLFDNIRWAMGLARFLTKTESNWRIRNEHLYAYNIHHLMYHISSLSPSDLPGEKVYNFRRRARGLLDKWEPLLRADVEARRWAFQGAHSVVYVPKDDAIRSASPDEMLKKMIYGAKFWPQKYSESWDDMQVALQFVD
ncbi:hypothetical protein JR316_0008772 [Psilocybe cubensis]|uniref:F-box domain-containing protein n=2 Tax=Psilocybe cubensis TaxID=181762 RepID=A0A8H7XUL6_PSICU|nr:hypothetical protein JR316_0008772 [Psilocybe cubensis]KAH9478319.1 hypothetical protein JR316_0008772 [Psilocybe cubensis]